VLYNIIVIAIRPILDCC